MNVFEYSHSEEFWKDNQDVISRHILQAELVYLNARNNLSADQGFFGAAVKDTGGTMLAIQTKPYPMIFLGAGGAQEQLSSAMAAYLADRKHLPQMLHGDTASTQPMLRALAAQGARYHAGRRLLQRRCDALIDVKTLPLELISAAGVDYDFMQDYQNFLEECHAMYDPQKLRRDIDAMLASNDLYVLMDEGQVVTMGRLQRRLPGGRAIGVIYTPPAYRGRGYSTCCCKGLTRMVFDSGCDFAYLYAEADNPVSNRVYEKLGYEVSGEFIEYHCDV